MRKSIMRIQLAHLVSTVALLLALSSASWAEEPASRLIDSSYEAVEANTIELVRNNDGDVVQIRGKGCPRCPSSSILPAQDLIVEAGRRKLEAQDFAAYSGGSGVIHIYTPTGLAHRVSFIGYVEAEEGDQ